MILSHKLSRGSSVPLRLATGAFAVSVLCLNIGQAQEDTSRQEKQVHVVVRADDASQQQIVARRINVNTAGTEAISSILVRVLSDDREVVAEEIVCEECDVVVEETAYEEIACNECEGGSCDSGPGLIKMIKLMGVVDGADAVQVRATEADDCKASGKEHGGACPATATQGGHGHGGPQGLMALRGGDDMRAKVKARIHAALRKAHSGHSRGDMFHSRRFHGNDGGGCDDDRGGCGGGDDRGGCGHCNGGHGHDDGGCSRNSEIKAKVHAVLKKAHEGGGGCGHRNRGHGHDDGGCGRNSEIKAKVHAELKRVHGGDAEIHVIRGDDARVDIQAILKKVHAAHPEILGLREGMRSPHSSGDGSQGHHGLRATRRAGWAHPHADDELDARIRKLEAELEALKAKKNRRSINL